MCRAPAAILVAVVCALAPSAPAGPPLGERERAFLEAAAAGDLEAVNAALAAGIDADTSRDDGWTALHAAAERSRTEVLERLIAAGADVNARGFLGVRPLHWAAIRGPGAAVQALIDAGALVNVDAIREDTPLGAAASAGNLETARILIAAGADVNGGKHATPLMLATRHSHAALIELLVESGAAVNDPENPPLHWAGEPGAAAALIRAGADVNLRDSKGRTALHLTTGHWVPGAAAVEVLIAAGADVNARSPEGRTPLHEAVERRHLGTAKLLIQAGADVDARDRDGNTPLSLAKEAGEAGAPVVEVLVAAGARIDGFTELQRAALAGDLTRILALLSGGADVDERGPRRTTAVHLAGELGRVEILKVLIEAGAKVDLPDQRGMTPLHRAANAAVAERLIAAGAPVAPARSAESSVTPMYMAVVEGRADVVRVLIAHGAPFEGGDTTSVLVWAAFAGRLEVVEVLLDAGADPDAAGARPGERALHVVAKGGFADMESPANVTPELRLEIARLLIARGADANAAADVGYFDRMTPLHGAAGSGHDGIAAILIEHGARLDAAPPRGTFAGFTPLHAAARGGHAAVVELLLRHGAEAGARTGPDYYEGTLTPLEMAKDPGVRALLKRGDGESERP